MSRRARLLLFLVSLTSCAPALAQEPRRLPASVTGVPAPGGVRPAGETGRAAAPIERFVSNLRDYPPETGAAVYAARDAADLLYRVNLPSGRFAFGGALEDDGAQASAALALAEVAAFMGSPKLAARAGGSVLSLLALTGRDPADAGVRRPLPTLKGEPTHFAATLILAILAQPQPPPSQVEEAGRLGAYLVTRVKPTGEVVVAGGDPETAAATPGVVLEALLAVDQARPSEPVKKGVESIVTFYANSVKSGVTMTGAAALVPGFVEFAARRKDDPRWVAAAFALADVVAAAQVGNGRQPNWAGGFADRAGAEPSAAGAARAVRALCRAAWLTRQVPDLARFHSYRARLFAGFAFLAARRTEAAGIARASVALLQSGAEGFAQ